MKIIIDADSIAYKAAGAAQKRNKETKEMEYAPLSHALSNAKTMLTRILNECEGTDYTLWLTEINDSKSYRKALYPAYKANRAKLEKPKYLEDVRKYMITKWNAQVVNTIEADDKVCMEQYKHTKGFIKDEQEALAFLEYNKPQSIVVGIDKDLYQIPGAHYNYDRKEGYYITPLQAWKNLCKQILEGDRSDNVPRIKKGWLSKKRCAKIDKETSMIVILNEVLDEFNLIHGENACKELLLRADLLCLQRREKDKYLEKGDYTSIMAAYRHLYFGHP